MAKAYAQQGCLVIYCNPDYARSPEGFQNIGTNLYCCRVDIEIMKEILSPLVVVFSYNKQWLSSFIHPRVIYEYIDELVVFQKDIHQLTAYHEELLQTASLVVATAQKLLEQVKPIRPDALLNPNGVDYEHFQATRYPATFAVPSDLQPVLAEGKPVIGYYGALAHWFDYELLAAVSNFRPDWNFILIGPDYDGSLTRSRLLEQANVRWLGVRDYDYLPRYLRCFDVASIPFKVNDITCSTSPLKLFEYMAGGKPVVITPMSESMRTEGVLVADGPEQFIQKVEEALNLRHDADYLALIDRVARENTWNNRAASILERFPSREPQR
jgi:hypothetical protein